MASAKKKTTSSSASSSSGAARLEARVKALESRVKELEDHKLHLPTDFNETKGKIITWARENPAAALGTAIIIGLFLGLVLS